MFQTRKFFEADSPSVAGFMASKGVLTEPNMEVEIPSVITESKEQTSSAEPVSPAATATDALQQTEKANPESSQPASVAKATEPAKEELRPTLTWQEVLKKEQPGTILKELGLDEKVVNELKELDPKMVSFLSHWKAGGDLTRYLRELTTDYSKMSAEDVMRHQLRNEYPKASEKQLQILFEEEVVEKYKLDPEKYTEQEVERGRLLLQAKADRHRDSLTSEQQNFLLPKPPEPKPSESDVRMKKESEALEVHKSQIASSQYIKDIIKNKSFGIGEGDTKFNFPVSEPEKVIELLTDSGKWYNLMFNEDGSPKIERQFRVGLFAKDPDNYDKELAKYFLALGGKAAIEPIENAKKPADSTPASFERKPQNAAEAMAKQGVVISGGY